MLYNLMFNIIINLVYVVSIKATHLNWLVKSLCTRSWTSIKGFQTLEITLTCSCRGMIAL